MPNEMEVWSLWFQGGLTNAVYFVGLAFLLWVSFRAANIVGESENLLGKIFVTVFCLVIVFQLNFNFAGAAWVTNGIAGAFSAMQAEGVEISSGAQTLINASEPGKDFSLVPNVISGLFILAILGMQMSSIWTKK